jgi:hypothetical protein
MRIVDRNYGNADGATARCDVNGGSLRVNGAASTAVENFDRLRPIRCGIGRIDILQLHFANCR